MILVHEHLFGALALYCGEVFREIACSWQVRASGREKAEGSVAREIRRAWAVCAPMNECTLGGALRPTKLFFLI